VLAKMINAGCPRCNFAQVRRCRPFPDSAFADIMGRDSDPQSAYEFPS
jgi:hypothetical protein